MLPGRKRRGRRFDHLVGIGNAKGLLSRQMFRKVIRLEGRPGEPARYFGMFDSERCRADWSNATCQKSEYLPPMRAKSGPVRLDPKASAGRIEI